MQSANQEKSSKKLRYIQRSVDRHWVGDGFPIQTLFAYSNLDPLSISPFLLFDYGGPMNFPPMSQRRGVGAHPHRGFETVTIVYQGEVEHRDSSGGGGIIGTGDVQWMTAASGLVHDEFHSHNFAQRGGTFEMVQLWVNLPAKNKMAPPRYQSILSTQIPVFGFPDGGGIMRIIAGEFANLKGPAKTFTPIHIWDLRLASDQQIDLEVPIGYNTILAVLKGVVRINESKAIRKAEIGLFNHAGKNIYIDCMKDAKVLLLSGEPIYEPVVGQGPFVMNSHQEICQAIIDYQNGKMGRLP
ncbi:MAG: pirin family protein [Pleurocapsa sp. MO_192.B19]|nr:pirin family protein [Pleurocapsa sp. MO_192.B19]